MTSKMDSENIIPPLPFSGPVQLPTKMQSLKLFWFLKDEVGRFNSWGLTKGKIVGIVARVIGNYWTMAGYDMVSHSSICTLIKNIDFQAGTRQFLSEHFKSIHEDIKFPCDQCNYSVSKSIRTQEWGCYEIVLGVLRS